MSTATSPSPVTPNGKQRDWIVKMGGLLGVPTLSPAGDNNPLTGANPAVLWEQQQKSVDVADSIVREMENAQSFPRRQVSVRESSWSAAWRSNSNSPTR